jgi:hypothetical protein
MRIRRCTSGDGGIERRSFQRRALLPLLRLCESILCRCGDLSLIIISRFYPADDDVAAESGEEEEEDDRPRGRNGRANGNGNGRTSGHRPRKDKAAETARAKEKLRADLVKAAGGALHGDK